MLDIPGIGRTKLFAILRELGVLQRGLEFNLPMQKYINAGYFTVIAVPFYIGEKVIYHTVTRVTAAGIEFIRRTLDNHGYIPKCLAN